MTARALAAALCALLAACEPLPEPYPRVVAAGPSGVVPALGLRVVFTTSEPLDEAELGRRVAICLAEDLREVKRLAEAGDGVPPALAVAARAQLGDGGHSLVLVPEEPLVPGFAYAAVLAHGARAADGRTVLDAEGRPRSTVVEFEVSPMLAGPVRAEITKVLADAAAPEAGGEYVEVTNLGPEPLDLAGFRLAKRGPTGAFSRCTILRRVGVAIASGDRGLVVGGAYDGRYPLPPAVTIAECGGSAVAGGLANDRAPALLLEDPSGNAVSSIGVAGAAPRCDGGALVRVDPGGPDLAENLACTAALAPSGASAALRAEGVPGR